MDIYFNIIPKELIEIIVSYLSWRELERLYYLLTLELNWGIIYLYRFGVYKNVGYSGYFKRLRTPQLFTMNELKNILRKSGIHVGYTGKTKLELIDMIMQNIDNPGFKL